MLECLGLEQAVVAALEIARPGGAIGRVGVPEHDTPPTNIAFWKNASRDIYELTGPDEYACPSAPDTVGPTWPQSRAPTTRSTGRASVAAFASR